MNIITGYRGEPHITSAQDRAGNQGSYGTGSYVLDVGNKLAATISSSNEIRIADGAICHQGCLANIDAGTYDSVSINNGAQGVNRIDRIVARYTKNAETNVESLNLVVIQGTAVSGTPSAPAYRTGNIQNGDSPVDMPLYQVRLTGVTVASVTREFDYVRTQKELDAAVSSLNSKAVLKTANGTVTTSASGTANISSIVPSRFYPFLVQVENTSAFVYMMVNTNGTFWIRCLDWDGNRIANTSLSVVIFCIDSQAISNWRTN